MKIKKNIMKIFKLIIIYLKAIYKIIKVKSIWNKIMMNKDKYNQKKKWEKLQMLKKSGEM